MLQNNQHIFAQQSNNALILSIAVLLSGIDFS